MALRNGRTSANIQTILVGSVHPPGVGAPFWGAVAPEGWVLASGRTVGSTASGSTERANDDTFYLYKVLWESYDNTILVIQNSAGTPTTRGASAAADFAANKRLPTIDMRGRTAVGKDNMGGTTASRVTAGESGITGTTLGATGGSQSHALSIAQLAAHNHSQTAHSHSIIARYYNAGSPWNDNYAAGSPYVHRGPANIPSLVDEWIGGLDSPAPAIQNNGSGSTHQNTQPSIICNYILKL